ncbi:MAG: InlB B-repeat-containing protein [Clostridia bacterium]|nr:InlB B-repeat-containing protein [Clostridia bacterium]
MKKSRVIFLITFLVAAVCLTAGLFGCAKKYTVTYLAAEGGYLSGETTQIVSAHKDTTMVSVEPLDGYYFDGWSDGEGHFVRVDKDVTSDITVTATFKRWTFTVQYIAGSNGKIEGESSQTVNMYDNSAEVTAVPNEGYVFVGWSDDVSEATRFEESVENNVKVYAKFEPKTYGVKFSAGANGSIDGECEQTVTHGKNHSSVTATPDWGYVFTGWSDGVQTATRSDKVYTDIDVTAYFERGFEGGDGSVKNPFTISTYKQLRNIVSYPAEYFKLVNDLDLTGINHVPLFETQESTAGGSQPFNVGRASESKSFTGELDGGGHSIKNMIVDSGSQYPSLFGVLDRGFVKNLSIENASIKTVDFDTTGGKYYVGILAGVLNGFAQNVTVSGEIIADGLHHDGVTVGGLAGQAFYPMLNCLSNVDITANDVVSNQTSMTNPFCFGGLAGVCSSWSITGCEANGTITINNSQAINPNRAAISAGGLIGYCFDTGNTDDDTDEEIGATVRIVDCHSSVNIIENESDIQASGFISLMNVYKFEISDCLSKGHVQAYIAAGFFNSLYAQTKSVIENCQTEGNIDAKARACGFVSGGTIKNANFLMCSVGGNISATGYAGGFFYYTLGAVTAKDCIVESSLTGNYACGFAYYSVKNTIFERCGFTGSIQCVKGGAGICYNVNGSKILNCYSVGNVSVNNVNTTDEVTVGGLCSRVIGAQIENCYFAGTITVEAEYRSNSYLGIIVGSSRGSAVKNCHTLHAEDSDIQDVIGKSYGDGNEYDIASYATVEDMYNIADALNEGQEEAVWQNVPDGLPELIA